MTDALPRKKNMTRFRIPRRRNTELTTKYKRQGSKEKDDHSTIQLSARKKELALETIRQYT